MTKVACDALLELMRCVEAEAEADGVAGISSLSSRDFPKKRAGSSVNKKKRKEPTALAYDSGSSFDEDSDRDEEELEPEGSESSIEPPPLKKSRRLEESTSPYRISPSSSPSTSLSASNGELPLPAGVDTVLPPSKNPCLDALAYCVVMRLGAEQTDEDLRNHTISIFDCSRLLGYVKFFCPKATQTNNDEYRIKALKRWFNDIPTKKMRLSGNTFVIKMKSDRRHAIRKVIRRMLAFANRAGVNDSL